MRVQAPAFFGVTDIGWGSGTGHNIGKLGNAFLTELNKSAPDGICATPLAAPPRSPFKRQPLPTLLPFHPTVSRFLILLKSAT